METLMKKTAEFFNDNMPEKFGRIGWDPVSNGRHNQLTTEQLQSFCNRLVKFQTDDGWGEFGVFHRAVLSIEESNMYQTIGSSPIYHYYGYNRMVRCHFCVHIRAVSIPCPFHVRSMSVPCPFLVRSMSVPGPFQVRSIRPFHVRSMSVPCPFHVRSMSVPCPFQIPFQNACGQTAFQRPFHVRFQVSAGACSLP